jgi:protein-tyrosine-phosphatase
MNILVLCTGNSARSILLEAVLADLGYNSYSAGSKPAGAVHPVALTTLKRHDVKVDAPRSKSWDEFAQVDAPVMDLVVTVCGNAAGETCPVWPAKDGVAPLRIHWGVEDPAAAPEADQPEAFETAFQILRRRAVAFDALADKRDEAALSKLGQLP